MTDQEARAGHDDLVGELLEVTRRVHQVVSAVAARHDLTPQQVELLRMLDKPVSMRAFAEDLLCDPSNVTGLVDRVERLGLVERVSEPRDRRVRVLTLTARGRRLRDRVNHDIARGVRDTFGLAPDDSREVARLLGTMHPEPHGRGCGTDPNR